MESDNSIEDDGADLDDGAEGEDLDESSEDSDEPVERTEEGKASAQNSINILYCFSKETPITSRGYSFFHPNIKILCMMQ